MTIARMLGLAIILTVTGIAVVAMRVDQCRHLRQVQELQFQQSELKQRIWQQEMELARLRSPQMIRDRADRLDLAAGTGNQGEVQGVSHIRR
ncbi:MAG: hypothetical protein JSV03_01015 [Planctomycetota bacterium]|nr:MAG: hypothetical protein JSV03_01015 [Planctomycetota bacterium]